MEDSDDSSAHESDFSVESDDDDIPTDQPRSIEALDGGAVAALAALDDDGLAEQVWDCYDGLALAASGGSAAAAAVAARVRGALSARERVLVVRTAVARCDDGAAWRWLGGGARRAGAAPERLGSVAPSCAAALWRSAVDDWVAVRERELRGGPGRPRLEPAAAADAILVAELAASNEDPRCRALAVRLALLLARWDGLPASLPPRRLAAPARRGFDAAAAAGALRPPARAARARRASGRPSGAGSGPTPSAPSRSARPRTSGRRRGLASSVDSASSGSDDSDRGDSDSDAGDRAVVDGDRVSAPATAADLVLARPRFAVERGGRRAAPRAPRRRGRPAQGLVPRGRVGGLGPGAARLLSRSAPLAARAPRRARRSLALLRRAGRCAVARDAALELRCGRRLLRVVAACADEAAGGPRPARASPRRRTAAAGAGGCSARPARTARGAACSTRSAAAPAARAAGGDAETDGAVAEALAGLAALDRDVGRGYDALHARLDAHLGFLALARAVAAAPALPAARRAAGFGVLEPAATTLRSRLRRSAAAARSGDDAAPEATDAARETPAPGQDKRAKFPTSKAPSRPFSTRFG
ncbi:hypothetical protein JL721_3416 [Aureococcus anophagefferens]|nr:hypothetical protein JL721_3416 [Aureococcus anophagefferens]